MKNLFTIITFCVASLFTVDAYADTPMGVLLPNGDVQYTVPFGFDIPQFDGQLEKITLATDPNAQFHATMLAFEQTPFAPYSIAWNRTSFCHIYASDFPMWSYDYNYQGSINGFAAPSNRIVHEIHKTFTNFSREITQTRVLRRFSGDGIVELTWLSGDSGSLYSPIGNPEYLGMAYSWLDASFILTYTPAN